MAKILCIGDLHFGEKGDDLKFNQQIIEFIEWACTLGKELKVSKCVQFGDFFHQRNKINVQTLNYGVLGAQILGETFGKDNTYVLEGNHDLYYKDRLDISSVNILDPYVTIISEPTTIDNILMIPWIIDNEMWDDVIKQAKNHEFLYSHLELNGFKVNDQYLMEHGYSPKELKRYKRVVTGHYHSRQTQGNIHYIGTPYPITMNEANEAHGVYIHDLVTDDFEFIPYEKIKVISIPYDQIDSIKDYDPTNTTIRIEFPADLEDETVITDIQEQLSAMNFMDSKIKYKGKKLKELLEQEVDVEEVENVDEFVLKSFSTMTAVTGIESELLTSIYEEAIVRGQNATVSEEEV